MRTRTHTHTKETATLFHSIDIFNPTTTTMTAITGAIYAVVMRTAERVFVLVLGSVFVRRVGNTRTHTQAQDKNRSGRVR